MPTVLSRAVRSVAPALAATADARAELLALIWDRQFDRGQALRLAGGAPPEAAAALEAAADRFDALRAVQQQRLRRWACGPARALRDNGPCPASC